MITEIKLLINSKYPLTHKENREFEELKVKGLNFNIKGYEAKGLGHVGIMQAKGFWGLMKMETVIINPIDMDMPLFSYDRIYAMGNDTNLLELYDTQIEKTELAEFDSLLEKSKKYPPKDLGEHWYDYLQLPQTITVKGKKDLTDEFDTLVEEYFETFLKISETAKKVEDKAAKCKKTCEYVDGLLNNGGASTDVFVKAIGKEKTTRLFHEVLFGVGE